jgi:hypothetical protein
MLRTPFQLVPDFKYRPLVDQPVACYQSRACRTLPNSEPMYARVKGEKSMWLSRVKGMAASMMFSGQHMQAHHQWIGQPLVVSQKAGDKGRRHNGQDHESEAEVTNLTSGWVSRRTRK